MKRSIHIDPSVVGKLLPRILPHPWIAGKLALLQGEKWLFETLYPKSGNGRARRIRQISLRLTDVCNLRCRTCGQWGERGFLHEGDLSGLKQAEISLESYRQQFRDLVLHGHHPLVYLWGGEPMLYEGTLDLVDAATALRLPASIATNGTRLAEAAERFVAAPLFLLQVSVDGHCSELHNQLRPSIGRGDNFAAVTRGLDAVQEARRKQRRKLPLIAALTVISRGNVDHLFDIYEAFRHRVDFFVFYLSWWIDEVHARAHETEFRSRFGMTPAKHRSWIGTWRPKEVHALDRNLRRIAGRARSAGAPAATVIPPLAGAADLYTYYTDHAARFGFDRCISIYQNLEVNSNGDVSPCRDYSDYVIGNIKRRSLVELWNAPSYQNFRSSVSQRGLMPVCSRCCGLMGY
jgi:radical SAM protein with 4Fe4S-binding SPASM domain